MIISRSHIERLLDQKSLRSLSDPIVRKRRGTWSAISSYYHEGKRYLIEKKTTIRCAENGKSGERLAKTEAKKWRDEIISTVKAYREEKHRAEEQAASVTVSEYIKLFIKKISPSIQRSTVASYKRDARRIDTIGDVRLIDLTHAQVQTWVQDVTVQGYAPSTVIKAYRLLSHALSYAVANGALKAHPCGRIVLPKRSRPKQNALDEQGICHLYDSLKSFIEKPKMQVYGKNPAHAVARTPKDRMSRQRLADAVMLALSSGMRIGEICGLTWRDVEMDRTPDGRPIATIRVVQVVGRDGSKIYIKEPKSRSSRRSIPIVGPPVEMLQKRKEEIEKLALQADVSFNRGWYVFGTIDGTIPSVHWISAQWTRVAKAYSICGNAGTPITFHDLRHTFATHAIAQGHDVKAVSATLGHASAAMTLDIYAEALPSAQFALAEAMSEVLTMKIKQTL